MNWTSIILSILIGAAGSAFILETFPGWSLVAKTALWILVVIPTILAVSFMIYYIEEN